MAIDGMITAVAYASADSALSLFRARGGGGAEVEIVAEAFAFARAALTDERAEWWLEQIDAYLITGLRVRQWLGPPEVIRIYGAISAPNPDLESLIGTLAKDAGLILDLRNCSGMGAHLQPLLDAFDADHPLAVWVPSEPVHHHLVAAGVDPARVFPTMAEARGYLSDRAELKTPEGRGAT